MPTVLILLNSFETKDKFVNITSHRKKQFKISLEL